MTVSNSAIANTTVAVRAVMPPWHTDHMVALDGKVIRKARKARDWTQYDLADELGVSQPTVQRWEAGKREPDTLADFVKLCDKLSISADALLGIQAKAVPAPPQPWLPKPETLAELLATAMHVDDEDLEKLSELRDYASAVRIGLEWIAEDHSIESDQQRLKLVRKRVAEAVAAARSASSQAA